MSTKIISSSICFILLAVLGSCAAPKETTPPTPFLTATFDVQPSSTPTIEVLNTPVLATDTMLPNNGESIPVCPKKGAHIFPSNDFGFSGTIVYQKSGQKGLYTIGDIPLKNSEISVDENQDKRVIGFSADGKWLAYTPITYDENGNIIFDNAKIKLLSSNGESKESILDIGRFNDELQVDHRLVGFTQGSYWINNDLIYADLFSQSVHDPTGDFGRLEKVLNPFKNIWREDLLEKLPNRNASDIIGISPDVSRALFEGKGLSLWDMENNQEIWSNPDLIAPFGVFIYWAPDSSMAVYSPKFQPPDQYGVLLITRGGKVTSIYNSSSPSPDFIVTAVDWSSDNRYLALAIQEGPDLSVYIYDTIIGKYISQCPIAKMTNITPILTWSPDGSYVAYSAVHTPILLLDVKTGDVIELVQDGLFGGWSNQFPVIWP